MSLQDEPAPGGRQSAPRAQEARTARAAELLRALVSDVSQTVNAPVADLCVDFQHVSSNVIAFRVLVGTKKS